MSKRVFAKGKAAPSPGGSALPSIEQARSKMHFRRKQIKPKGKTDTRN